MENKLAAIADIADRTFDFVIIGGGTSGCVLASRLSENPGVSVAVLEAGKAHFDDPLINDPLGWMKQLKNPEYDWQFPIKPQAKANKLHETMQWNRGKTLGGSSAINLLAWTKPARREMDAVETLGNPGWNWESFQKYANKAERFITPDPNTTDEFRNLYKSDAVGHDGPITISFTATGNGAESSFQKSAAKHGLDTIDDALSGNITGTWKAVTSIDPETRTRVSAATGYILPNLDRTNLKVLTEAYVERIIVGQGEQAVAKAVQFEYCGKLYQVFTAKEVILSAGGIKSPQILELSGIGDPQVLQPLGIPVSVDLPPVGANIQEHYVARGPILRLHENQGLVSANMLTDPVFASRLRSSSPSANVEHKLFLNSVAFVPLQTATPDAATIINKKRWQFLKETDSLPAGLQEQYQLQLHNLEDEQACDFEIMLSPFYPPPGADRSKPYLRVFPSIGHPWSRGTIHITSKDPKANPEIDPRYFDDDVDLEIMTAAFRYVRKIIQTEPLSDLVQTELHPGPRVDETSDDQVQDFLRDDIATLWHTCGSCSMLPKDKGGVVDPKLRVYGAKNLRVVDLSILPLQVAVHTQSVVYGLAEQAADIIKADWGL